MSGASDQSQAGVVMSVHMLEKQGLSTAHIIQTFLVFPIHASSLSYSPNSDSSACHFCHCVAYLVTGGVSFLLGILYFFVRLLKPRKFGDISKLKEVDT